MSPYNTGLSLGSGIAISAIWIAVAATAFSPIGAWCIALAVCAMFTTAYIAG